jgi:hypothetical protein
MPLSLLLMVVATLLLGGSALIRGETLLAFPGLLATPVLGRNRAGDVFRKLGAALLVCIGAFAIYSAVMSLVPGSTAAAGGESKSFTAYVITYMQRYEGFSGVLKGFAYWAVAVGPLVAMLGVAGTVFVIAKRRVRTLLFALAWIIPPAAFFLLDPQPARHFLVTAVGLAILATVPMWRWQPAHQLIGLAVLLVGNYASGIAAYRAIDAKYSWHYTYEGPRRTSLVVPLGGMIAHRHAADVLVAKLRADAEEIAALRGEPVFAVGTRTAIRLAHVLTLRYPEARWSVEQLGEYELIHVATPDNEFCLSIDRNGRSLSGLFEEVAAAGRFDGYRFYEFPVDQVAGDLFTLPPGLEPLRLAARDGRSVPPVAGR